MIGLASDDVGGDGWITMAPSGGALGLKRSTPTDATVVPLHPVATRTNRHDGPLLGPGRAGSTSSGACHTL
jgi:hypothetical protein